MDTSDEATILEVARQLEGQPIDLIINNAGINLPGSLETGTKEVLMRQFEVNAVGPFLVARTLLPNLQLAENTRGFAFVVQLSSFVGSMGSHTSETAAFFKDSLYGYGTSKAALNMITRSLAFDLQPKDIGKRKPADCVAAMTDLIAKLTPESTGKFINLDQQIPVAELPW
ncbi:hypothetical protein PC121_g2647 [Phytophthora cactorum]|nr:hypothetical protein PC120_g12636 [Phytophthora cactorum]KAG3096079.1 hypothetical protein PC121_g2647 [Phytophthora cactorum]KAG4055510.1 hypothetical protein PC123_g9405 [Phytophthora cactorum]